MLRTRWERGRERSGIRGKRVDKRGNNGVVVEAEVADGGRSIAGNWQA